jgi:paraquat-inducible protein A
MNPVEPTAAASGLAACHTCGQLSRPPAAAPASVCLRCGARLHTRIPGSIERAWALLIAAVVLYVPANLLPIMRTTTLGRTQEDTILSGVLYLYVHGMWPLALIVFVASILVPVAKILVLSYLLLSVQLRSRWSPLDRTRLYRITDFVGRWSMVDVFVVTVLVALIQVGNLAQIRAADGALYFAAVVILTMLAATSFDPRLIWDARDQPDG